MLPDENDIQTDEELELVKCNLCDSEDFSLLFKGYDYLFFSQQTFKVARCNNCGLICLNPRPKKMAHYYQGYNKGVIEKDVFSWLSPNKAKRVKKLKGPGKILDVGCGKGRFLLNIMKEGWDVYGNEISQDACNFARNEYGLKNIKNSDLLLLDFPENFFDVITLWHVLEHLEKPRETLEFISKILKDDGVIVIECPNFSSLQRKIFKDKWQALELPQHLYQFSPKTIKKMLNKTGFEICKKDYIIDPRVSFIDMKRSLLRWLGIQMPVKVENKEELNSLTDSHKAKISWRLTRFMFNWLCLFLSSFLNLINCKDLFRVYCKKKEKDFLEIKEE